MDDEVKLGIYRHFKKGDEYEVLWVARDCENPQRKIVVYRGLYDHPQFGPNAVWTRDLEDFVGFKEMPDGKKVKRFEFIGDKR